MPRLNTPFRTFVEIGRVVYVTRGAYRGKLVVIIDVLDQNRALVEGPTTGVPRTLLNFKSGLLTKFVVKVAPGVIAQFAETKWAKKIAARKALNASNDFDRFRAHLAKEKRDALVKSAFIQFFKNEKASQ